MRPKPDADGIVRYKLRMRLSLTPIDKIKQERLTDIVFRRTLATDKQIEFALGLLRSRGFSIGRTNERFAEFELPVESGISVEAWLANLSIREIGTVIEELKGRPLELDFGG